MYTFFSMGSGVLQYITDSAKNRTITTFILKEEIIKQVVWSDLITGL
jgi:hypothetical protein